MSWERWPKPSPQCSQTRFLAREDEARCCGGRGRGRGAGAAGTDAANAAAASGDNTVSQYVDCFGRLRMGDGSEEPGWRGGSGGLGWWMMEDGFGRGR